MANAEKKKYVVTVLKPELVAKYNANRVYDAIDEIDAIAQMCLASDIKPTDTYLHKFKAKVVEESAQVESLAETVVESAPEPEPESQKSGRGKSMRVPVTSNEE